MKMVKQICRACLIENNDNQDMQSIFDLDKENIEISHMLSECGGIEIEKINNFPEYICINCNRTLKIFYDFRKICQISDQKLRLNYTKITTINSENEIYLPDDSIQIEERELDNFVKTEQNDDNPLLMGLSSNLEEHSDSNDSYKTTKNRRQKHVKTESEISKKPTVVPLSMPTRSQTQEGKLFICEICGNIYNKIYILRRHRITHSDILPFECEICNKKFRQNTYLARHMRSHTGHKPHTCKFCERSFADLSTKIKHERLHTGERPYKCDTCNKTFSYSDVLKKHILVHTGEKPFRCELCGTSFSRKHHLTTHLKSLIHMAKIS